MLSGFSGRLFDSATSCSNFAFRLAISVSVVFGLGKSPLTGSMLPSIFGLLVNAAARRPMPMTAVAKERMSRVDTAWLRMDNDVNLMMIVGVWLLQPGITHAALRARVEDKLLKYERFLQRVEPDALGANWVADEDFEIGRHVLHQKLHREPGVSERES